MIREDLHALPAGTGAIKDTGACLLCLQSAPLQQSHILPAWVYRRVAAASPLPGPVIVKDGSAVITSSQVRERLLCFDCEQRFSRWERLMAGETVQDDGTFPWLSKLTPRVHTAGATIVVESGVSYSLTVDTTTVASFGASVIWRASVSTKEPACLGDAEEPFRRYLLGLDATFPANAFLLVYLLGHDGRVASMPKSERAADGSVVLHWFVACGVRFQLWIGERPPEVLARACFVRNELVLLQGHPAFAEGLVKKVGESKAKGKLSKMGGR